MLCALRLVDEVEVAARLLHGLRDVEGGRLRGRKSAQERLRGRLCARFVDVACKAEYDVFANEVLAVNQYAAKM